LFFIGTQFYSGKSSWVDIYIFIFEYCPKPGVIINYPGFVFFKKPFLEITGNIILIPVAEINNRLVDGISTDFIFRIVVMKPDYMLVTGKRR
jgi:hypothetical protein